MVPVNQVSFLATFLHRVSRLIVALTEESNNKPFRLITPFFYPLLHPCSTAAAISSLIKLVLLCLVDTPLLDGPYSLIVFQHSFYSFCCLVVIIPNVIAIRIWWRWREAWFVRNLNPSWVSSATNMSAHLVTGLPRGRFASQKVSLRGSTHVVLIHPLSSANAANLFKRKDRPSPNKVPRLNPIRM